VSKAFTAIVLADMVTRGEIALGDGLGFGTRVTLEQLATHTSGLPRLPTNLPLQLPDPYGPYTTAQLEEFLASSAAVSRSPGTYDYSNLGAGALGHALEIRARMPFAALVAARVARPLGLARTRVGDVGGDTAVGYQASGEPAASWKPGALSGAYAVRSTVRDLAAFVAANLAPDATPLAAAIRLTHEPRHAIPGGHIGLAWHIAGPSGVLWHNGRSAGFAAFVAFHPQRRIGLVVLANTSSEQVDPLAAALIQSIVVGGQ
jgi:serine-type D-Ala-D-Ala carboxypeptidase/endopeptidase